MKRVLILMLFVMNTIAVFACSVCEKQQPKLLQGITHGTGPDSQWDYMIVSIIAVIVVFTLYFSVKWIIHPGEQAANHIKRTVLKNE